MTGKAGFLLLAAGLIGMGCAGSLRAQEVGPAPRRAEGSSKEPEILRTLPQVADQPRSLYAPAPAPAGAMPALDTPYFAYDPVLDRPELPPPGWLAGVEVGIVTPHVKNHALGAVQNSVQAAAGVVDTVRLPSATLDWTASPRFELGYRLPSGFGDFVLGYRFLASQGDSTVPTVDGTAALHSRLDINQADFDYASRELCPLPLWDMRWRFGVRYANVFYDSRATEPLALAAAGSGIFDRYVSNRYVGAGPHVALDLARRFEGTGLAIFGRADFTTLVGRIRQQFSETSVLTDAAGLPLVGSSSQSTSQAAPVMNIQAGVRWQPPACRCASFFAGYQYEKWWDVGRLGPGDTGGEIEDQGVVLQATFNF